MSTVFLYLFVIKSAFHKFAKAVDAVGICLEYARIFKHVSTYVAYFTLKNFIHVLTCNIIIIADSM